MMKKKKLRMKKRNTPVFLVALLSIIIAILALIYVIYLRFIPYTTLEYDGYAVSGKDIVNNLLNTNFDVDHSIKALEVKDQDSIYENLNSYYLGASKQDNINLNYPIYVNNALALYNLSSKVKLITDEFQEIPGYSGTTLTSGELYNANTLQRADYYDYILLKNSDNLYINTKKIKIKTSINEYTIKMNSIINFTRDFITYYSLKDNEFVYDKILDADENSTITFEDYNRTYTYKEFLMNLGIIREETNSNENTNNTAENEVKNENKVEENKTENNTAKEEIKEEPKQEEEKETTDDSTSNVDIEKIWIKPTVTCDDFSVNVYSALTNLKIYDPSRVIYKAITFTFYKDDEIAFRVSSASQGQVSVTKLMPDTKYKIVGKYQYRNREGNLIENTVIEQEIKTKGVETLKPIELNVQNGQVYSNKIELSNLQIVSDVSDEAIYGVTKAEILINGTKYPSDSNLLRQLLKGENVVYQSPEGLKSNTNIEYEVRFYDTAGNIMNLKNNTGTTVTSKKAPSVKIKVSAQEVVSVTVEPTLINEDKIDISNYRYVLYSESGEMVSSGEIKENEKLVFNELNPQKSYTIKVFANFDIADGKGMVYDQEIGNSTFITLPLSKLGTLKLNVNYDIDKDITCNSINLTTSINTEKTDLRLIKILKSVNLSIVDEQKNIIKSIEMNNIDNLVSEEGIQNLIENLNSNTSYDIEITAKAKQGDTEEKINVSYTLKKFLTNKLPAKLNISNIVATTNLVDMDVYIDDVDNSCLEKIVNIRFSDSYDKEYLPKIEPEEIKSNTKIPTNQWVRLTYSGLTENETYTLSAEVASYNETNDVSKVQNNFIIDTEQFITQGLGGKVELIGMERQKKQESVNLVDVKSENNWYSQCFDTLKTSYGLDDTYAAKFDVESKYNFGKTYTEDNDSITLNLLSKQCYVYDLSAYAGQTVTMSFEAKITEPKAKSYIQIGKEIGKNIELLDGIGSGAFKEYTKTLTVPDDGYVGFYLEKYEETIPPTEEDGEPTYREKDYNLIIKNLKVEIGSEKTKYDKYGYDFFANIDVNFLDENHLTYDKQEDRCKYFIRMTNDKGLLQEYDYTYDSTEHIKESYKYKLDETNEEVEYIVELIIKQYGREYVLSTVKFNYSPETCTEIKSISTVEEFKEIQPYGNYILLNDIDLTDAKTTSEFTFGNPNISFYGSIDFNGKTVKKDTYSLTRGKETTSYIFYNIDKKATLKNAVLDYYINNTKNRYTLNVEGIDTFIAKEDGIYGMFLHNSGRIDNIMLNLKGCTKKQRINVGLVGYQNSGMIENLIVNFENVLYGSQYLSGVCLYSDGTIQNGYLYGNGIEAIGNITIGDYRYIAGVVFQMEGKGLLQNIYNIVPIKMTHADSTYSYAANIVYNVGYPPVKNETTGAIISTKDSTAIVRNVYSVQPLITIYNDYEYYGIMDSSNKEGNVGPNILYKYTSTQVKESYYFCDVIYEANDNNTKSSATALYEPGVQDVMLNANGFRQFLIDVFVSNGYYPHLNLNYCMPKQENIKIDVVGTEIIDVLSGEVIENNDISKLELSDKVKNEIETYIKANNVDLKAENLHLASFRVYNPAGTTISEINVKYLTTRIMSQTYSKKVSTVYVILNNPTSYLDKYDIDSVRSKMANGKIKESVYGENSDLGIRTIDVRFIKDISTAEEWNNINNQDKNGVSGLIQNYRLIKDIDFGSADFAPYITGNFQGYINGEYNGQIHRLKNIEGTSPLIKTFSKGTIKNLYIDNFVINSSSQVIGMIERAVITDNIEISNIHINDMEITTSYNGGTALVGGICGYIESGSTSDADKIKVQNCSIQNLNIEFTNKLATGIRVGGMIGYIYTFGGVDTYITNSFVQNLLINAEVTSYSGIGGILGYKTHSGDERIKKGTPYMYIQNCYTTGKINTYMYAGGIAGYVLYGNTYINNCYSMVNITSRITSGNAYIGGITGYGDSAIQNTSGNFYLGNIYVAGNNVGAVNRILGSNAGTASYRNYAYKDQLINGETSTKALGATKLLSYEEAFQMNTYSNLLQFGENYAYKIIKDGQEFNLLENEYLPQLNDTEGNVLRNQKLIAIDNDLKLDSITSTPSSDKTKVTVVMKFENRNNLNLTKVKIENDDMQVIDGTWKTSKDSNGLTVVTFDATPNRAYDSYKIQSIYYERNGQEVEKEIITKIKVELFKGISNATEWNEFFSDGGRTYEGQNVKITGDIDFSTVNKIESNVVVGKLEADSMKTFSNVNITSMNSNSGFIKEIKTSFKNITFENCNIKGNGNYLGIVSISRGITNNCQFRNINIESPGSYISIISRNIAGSMNNITLNNITVDGVSYVGSLCGQSSSTGRSANITGTYLKITGTGSLVGGIFGQADGVLTNIAAYQYSANGKKAADKETSWLVKGSQHVGGSIGQYSGGGNTITTVKTTNSKIQGVNFVGGNIGYGSGNTNDVTSNNNEILGTGNYVGGNVGYHGWTNSNMKSIENTISGNNYVGGNSGGAGNAYDTTIISENNNIKGHDYVGGCVGIDDSYYSNIYNAKSKGSNQIINGISHVGGVIGRTVGRIKNVQAEDCTINGTGNYVGGIVGSSEYSTTAISATNNTYYSIAGANAKNIIVTGNSNYVGGIAGYQVGTLYGSVLENSIVTGKGSNVGGIAGSYTGYTGTAASYVASSNFFLWHSYCTNSTIKGTSNVGGIAGKFIYGNIQYCYVANTSVISTENAVGGMVGYFDNSKLSNIQYKGTIKYNFVVNTEDGKMIAGNDSVGGVIGMAAKNLNYDEDIEKYNNIECNLVVTDIESYGIFRDMGMGSVSGNDLGTIQSQYMNNIYVYDCSRINGTQVGGIDEEKDSYSMISSSELSKNIYTKNEKITDEEGVVIGNKGLNFGNTRYDYSDGYFPTLKTSYSAVLYWDSGNLNIIQNKIPIPNRVAEYSEDTVSLNDMAINVASLEDVLDEKELPELDIYSSDIDKINIEFETVSKDSKFKVIANNQTIVEPKSIEKQVYTIEYDFITPLTITVFNSDYSYQKEIMPNDVRNLLSIVDDEYIYLKDNKIYSNKRTIDGEYYNIYDNQILDKDGNIYDITSMNKISETELKIKLLDTEQPIAEAKNNNTTIQTFAHCSKIIQQNGDYIYKNQQMFIKNGYMYVIDGKMKSKDGAAVIDTYNNKQYETILGKDGIMYDLLTELNYPTGFKNKNIKSITSNASTTSNIVLVYYTNGRVYGFNYATGEQVYDNNVKDEDTNLITYIANNLKASNVTYNIKKSDYTAAKELESKLDKVSVNEAIEKIGKDTSENINVDIDLSGETNSSDNIAINETLGNNTTISANKNIDTIDNDYVTVYDAGTQSYVVYNTAELIKSNSPKTQTENEKINQNKDLISYYTNLSVSTSKFKDAGIIIIATIVGSICVILTILYKKTNR